MTSYVNINSAKSKLIISELKRLGESTTYKLVVGSGLNASTINNLIRVLRASNMVHVSSWDWTTSRAMVRVYKWGGGIDVKKPMIDYKDKDLPKSKDFKPRPDIAASWLNNSI